MANDPGEENLKKDLEILQSMIDVSATTLEGLRTQCATRAELTRQEIRTLEVPFSKSLLKFWIFARRFVWESQIALDIEGAFTMLALLNLP